MYPVSPCVCLRITFLSQGFLPEIGTNFHETARYQGRGVDVQIGQGQSQCHRCGKMRPANSIASMQRV